MNIIEDHAQISLLYSYTLANRMDQKWKALYELEYIVGSRSSPYYLQVSALYFRWQIEREEKESELKTAQILGIDIISILKQQERIEYFQDMMTDCSLLMTDFWKEVTQKTPDGNKLWEKGWRIAQKTKSITAEFKHTFKGENQRNLLILNLYSDYLRLVTNEIEESKKISSKLETIKNSIASSRTFTAVSNLKNLESGNPCVIIASGRENEMGKIISVNSQTTSVLGYSRKELVGSCVEMIMPKAFADYHQVWMKRFLEKESARVTDRVRKLFVVNRKGFIESFDFLLKVVSDFKQGIKFAGIFTHSHSNQDPSIVINGKTGELIGINEQCFDSFGICPSLCYGSSHSQGRITIMDMMESLKSLSDINDKRLTTQTMKLDTTNYSNRGIRMLNNSSEGDFDLPDNRELLKEYQVRIEVNEAQKYSDDGFCSIEIKVKEVNVFSYTNSNIERDIIIENNYKESFEGMEIEEEKINTHELSKSNTKSKKLSIFTLISPKEMIYQNLQQAEQMAEDQLKAVIARNEKERNLKESRQLLRDKRTTPQVTFLFILATLFISSLFIIHSVILKLKIDMFDVTKNDLESTFNKSIRNILVNDIVLGSIRYNVTLFGKLPQQVLSEIQEKSKDQLIKLKKYEENTEKDFLKMLYIYPDMSQVKQKLKRVLRTGKKDSIELDIPDMFYQTIISYEEILKTTGTGMVSGNQNEELDEYFQAFYFLITNYANLIPKYLISEMNLYNDMYRRFFLSSFWRCMVCYMLMLAGYFVSLFIMFGIYKKIHLKLRKALEIFQNVERNEVERFISRCRLFDRLWVNNEVFQKRNITNEVGIEELDKMKSGIMDENKDNHNRVPSEMKNLVEDDENIFRKTLKKRSTARITSQRKDSANPKRSIIQKMNILPELVDYENEKMLSGVIEHRESSMVLDKNKEETIKKQATHISLIASVNGRSQMEKEKNPSKAKKREQESDDEESDEKNRMSFKNTYIGNAVWRKVVGVMFWLPLACYAFSRDVQSYRTYFAYTLHIRNKLDIMSELKMMHTVTYERLYNQTLEGISHMIQRCWYSVGGRIRRNEEYNEEKPIEQRDASVQQRTRRVYASIRDSKHEEHVRERGRVVGRRTKRYF